MGQLSVDLRTSLSRRKANSGVDGDDLQELIQSTLARAARFAPCLRTEVLDDGAQAAVVGILLDVIQRRLDLRRSGVVAGVSTNKTRGERSVAVDGKAVPAALFLPGEIGELQALCTSSSDMSTVGGGLPVGSFPPAPKWPC